MPFSGFPKTKCYWKRRTLCSVHIVATWSHRPVFTRTDHCKSRSRTPRVNRGPWFQPSLANERLRVGLGPRFAGGPLEPMTSEGLPSLLGVSGSGLSIPRSQLGQEQRWLRACQGNHSSCSRVTGTRGRGTAESSSRCGHPGLVRWIQCPKEPNKRGSAGLHLRPGVGVGAGASATQVPHLLPHLYHKQPSCSEEGGAHGSSPR